jgi:hypothetical protein
VFADRAPGLAAERLREPEKFDYPGIRREYNLSVTRMNGLPLI